MAESSSAPVTFEGLRGLAQALAVIDTDVLQQLESWLYPAGRVVEVDARRRFSAAGANRGPSRAESWAHSAESYETRVRVGGQALSLVVVAQRRRSSRTQQKRRPNYGGLQMRYGLLPARAEQIGVVEQIMERHVAGNLRKHGLM